MAHESALHVTNPKAFTSQRDTGLLPAAGSDRGRRSTLRRRLGPTPVGSTAARSKVD